MSLTDRHHCDVIVLLLLQGEIDSVVLMGGGTRVPRIQEALLSTVNK